MSIITVSREAYSHGAEIAGMVADELGFDCLGSEVIEKAASAAPQAMQRGKNASKKEIAQFRSAFYEHMSRDNVVYHGLAGHVFLSDAPSVLKVHLVADREDRVSEQIRRTGNDYERALEILNREDETRRQWHDQLFGSNQLGHDPYDLSLNLHNLTVEKAAKIIVDAASVSMEQDGQALQAVLTDLSLAAKVELKLLDHFADVQAEVRGGVAYVRVEGSIVQEAAAGTKARMILADLPGIRDAHVGIIPSSFVPF